MSLAGRILVIDDHPYMRDILAHFLEARGHGITLCPDGTTGIARVSRQAFDLVVTDLRLPDMPGWEVVRFVKQLRPDTPVALITGSGDLIDPKDLDRFGVDYLLPKPFTRERFMAVVASALGQPV